MTNFLIILLILIVIVGNIFIYGVVIYNKYQQYIIRINEVESYIDNTIREKYDLLNKSIGIIKGNTEIKEEIFPEIIKLRSRKMSSFELNRKLIDSVNEFNKIDEEHPELRESDAYIEIYSSLQTAEENIETYKDYYDNNIIKYNSLVRKFPTNLIAKIYKYEEKTFFDGKERNSEEDDIITI